MASLKEAIKSDDVDLIQSKTQVLAQASMKLGEAMYKAQGAGPGAEGPHAEAKDDVIDADFKEVGPDDKKKSA